MNGEDQKLRAFVRPVTGPLPTDHNLTITLPLALLAQPKVPWRFVLFRPP